MQTKLMERMWEGLNMPTDFVVSGQNDHFSITQELSQPEIQITQNFVGLTCFQRTEPVRVNASGYNSPLMFHSSGKSSTSSIRLR